MANTYGEIDLSGAYTLGNGYGCSYEKVWHTLPNLRNTNATCLYGGIEVYGKVYLYRGSDSSTQSSSSTNIHWRAEVTNVVIGNDKSYDNDRIYFAVFYGGSWEYVNTNTVASNITDADTVNRYLKTKVYQSSSYDCRNLWRSGK